MHQNWSTGEPCDCPFTTHLGKTASVKTADKLHDFLMNPESRPDLKTPEGQGWLKLLDHHYQHLGEKFDPLTPWLTREWKKGRLLHEYNPDFGQREPNHVGHMYYKSRDPHFEGYQRAPLNQTDLGHWSDFLQSNHPIRRQLGDIMQHDVGSFHGRVNDWSKAMEAQAQQQALEGGEVVHQTPDDWTVRRLRTPEELSAEGNAMGHCVGGYHDMVRRGDTQIYSLRDPNNTPHSTIEIKPKVTAHGPWNGPNQGEVVQIQGKANQEPLDEYKSRLAHWFRSFPDEQRPHWDDAAEDKPLWDDQGYSHYELDHPDLIPQYQEENGGLEKRTEPTEDAYGLLRYPTPMEADYDSLVNNIRFNSYGYYDTPEHKHIDDIYELAKARGEIPELGKAAENYEQEQNDKFYEWLDMNHEYAPRYVEEADPHGWADEEGEDVGEGEGQPYWEPEGSQGERYFDPAQAEKAYDDAIASWSEQHPGLQAGNRLYQYINQHATAQNPETGYIEFQNELRPDQTTAKTASNTHKNPWGDPCHCPWFKPIDKEHVGAVKEAAKLDWLRERPDVQKDLYKRFIVEHEFPRYGESADPLLPWFMREYNKGRLVLHENTDNWLSDHQAALNDLKALEASGASPEQIDKARSWTEETKDAAINSVNRGRGLHTGDFDYAHGWAPRFAEMMDSLKKRGKGVDVMQHDFPGMQQGYHQWRDEEDERERQKRLRDNGQIVHRVQHSDYPGWTVRRLQNADECSLEGELMGHCVGSYGEQVGSGHTNIYSLRDHKNEPHATVEVHPPYGDNPSDPEEWIVPEHAWDELPMEKFRGVPISDIRNYHDLAKEYGLNYRNRLDDHPAHQVFPEFMAKAVGHPPHEGGIAMPPIEGGNVVQTQGRSNDNPLPEYTDMLNEYLGKHGLQSQGNKWWDDWYEMEGPQDIRELLGSNGHRGEHLGFQGYPEDAWHEAQPDDYRDAESAAEEQGMDPPELQVGDPNYDTILESLVDPPAEYVWNQQIGNNQVTKPWTGYNPEAGDYVFNHAQDQGHLGRLGNALYDIATNEGIYNAEPFKPSPETLAIPDYWQRQRALQDAERAHHEQQGIAMDNPFVQMYNHLGPRLEMQPVGQYSYQTIHQLHPEQERLWDQEGKPYNQDYYNQVVQDHPELAPIAQGILQNLNVFSKVAHPLYKRWVFSPASGEVHLEDNSSDPLETKYHTDLARELNEPNLVHGYAYRIGDGWRLTDWDSRPVEDHFVIAQVMRALQSQKQNGADSWEPDYDDDWSRIHLGLPS